MAEGCKNVSSSKIGRYRYEMIGETQPEIELIEVASYIYPFSLKSGSSLLTVTRMWFFNTALLDFMCSPKFLLKKALL